MKTLFLVLIGFTLVFGQGDKENDTIIDSTENNRSALKLYLVNGISIAYKKEINSDWAWQLKFDADFNYNSIDFDRTYERIFVDTLLVDTKDIEKRFDDTEGQSFQINVQWFYNLYNIQKIKSYIGVGPLARYNREKNLTEYNWTELNGMKGNSWYEIEINSFYIGGSFLAGIEGKLFDYLSVFAEYELQIRYGWVENIRTIKFTQGFGMFCILLY